MVLTKAHALLRFMFALGWLLSSPVDAASWTASVDQENALPTLSKNGGIAMSSDFVFWGKNWAWTYLSRKFKIIAPYEYSMVGADQALNFTLTSHVKKSSGQQLVWEFDLNARNAVPDVVGGGIIFKLELTKFGSELGEPELLPDNRGWSWVGAMPAAWKCVSIQHFHRFLLKRRQVRCTGLFQQR